MKLRQYRTLLNEGLLVVVLLVSCGACSSPKECNGDLLVGDGGIEPIDSLVSAVPREVGADGLSEAELRLCELAREFRGFHSVGEKANRLRELGNGLSSARNNGEGITIDFLMAQLGLPAPPEGGGECDLFVPWPYGLFIRWDNSRKIVYSGIRNDRHIE